MQEIIQLVLNYLRGIWRFRWYAMLLAWVIPIIGWVLVAKIPDEYEATARVLVDTDSVLRPLLRGLTVETDVHQRLAMMTRTLLSRPNLEKVARVTDLDLNAKTPDEMESLLDELTKKIHISSARGANLYTISYTHFDPQMAKEVVKSLLAIFVESTLGDTRQDSDAAQKFLVQQIAEYEKRLIEAENRIKEFKQKNVALMPRAGQDYFELLQDSRAQLEQARLELEEALNRRDELRRQLVGEEPVFGFGNTKSASHPLDGRIAKLEEQLDGLLLQFTDKHPDVIAIQAMLENLKNKREQDQKSPMARLQAGSQSMEQNPVYQQTKISLGQAEASVVSLQTRVKEYTQRINELASKVDTIPEIEAELKSLNRDYALNKNSYDTLIARLESAKLSEKAERTGEDVKFTVVDPPRVPLTPSAPNRLMLDTLALIAGFASGVGLAFLLSQIRPAFYDQRTLQTFAGVPVFGVVSRLWTPELLRRKRLEFVAFVSVGVVLLFVYSGVMLLQYIDVAQISSLVEALKEKI
ncbi:MAG TPA: chain length-determining protein [Gammaproteobacteria bacterium]|nr:chain length-determining protein [Gammaproteobacteria bacterium]